jgi:hypothetical protein
MTNKEKEAKIVELLKKPEGLTTLASALASPFRGYSYPPSSELYVPLTDEERFEQMLINKAW